MHAVRKPAHVRELSDLLPGAPIPEPNRFMGLAWHAAAKRNDRSLEAFTDYLAPFRGPQRGPAGLPSLGGKVAKLRKRNLGGMKTHRNFPHQVDIPQCEALNRLLS